MSFTTVRLRTTLVCLKSERHDRTETNQLRRPKDDLRSIGNLRRWGERVGSLSGNCCTGSQAVLKNNAVYLFVLQQLDLLCKVSNLKAFEMYQESVRSPFAIQTIGCPSAWVWSPSDVSVVQK